MWSSLSRSIHTIFSMWRTSWQQATLQSKKRTFSPVYQSSRAILHYKKHYFSIMNIWNCPHNSQIVLSELEPPTGPTAQAQLPPTPNNSSSLLRQAWQVCFNWELSKRSTPFMRIYLAFSISSSGSVLGKSVKTTHRFYFCTVAKPAWPPGH